MTMHTELLWPAHLIHYVENMGINILLGLLHSTSKSRLNTSKDNINVTKSVDYTYVYSLVVCVYDISTITPQNVEEAYIFL